MPRAAAADRKGSPKCIKTAANSSDTLESPISPTGNGHRVESAPGPFPLRAVPFERSGSVIAMTPFRDEQVALLERVARLEDELIEAHGTRADQAKVVEELHDLTRRIEAAKTRGNADRTELDALSAAVDRIRTNLDGGDAPAPAPDSPSEKEEKAAPSPLLSFGLLAGSALLIGGLVFLLRREAEPEVTKPTDPTSLAEARVHASKAGHPASKRGDSDSGKLLVTMKAWYVSSDGMLHSNAAYSPRVDFVFATKSAPEPAPSVPRPIGAPVPLTTMFRDEYTVSMSPSDVRAEKRTSMFSMQEAIADPHCRLADVWEAARGAGAPVEAVAVIEYAEGLVSQRTKRGEVSRVPRWHFEISSTPPFSVDISDSDCSVLR